MESKVRHRWTNRLVAVVKEIFLPDRSVPEPQRLRRDGRILFFKEIRRSEDIPPRPQRRSKSSSLSRIDRIALVSAVVGGPVFPALALVSFIAVWRNWRDETAAPSLA